MLRTDLVKDKKEDKIKNVVVLMMENKSFDQMLGSIKKLKPELEGVDEKDERFNLDFKGNKIYQKVTTEKQFHLDPLHEVANVKKQLSNNNGGFVQDFITNYPNSTAEERQEVMAYYPTGFLPALHALAAAYTICDHWFSAVPGPTWTNRFFMLSGTSLGRINMPEGVKDPDLCQLFYQRQDGIFDRLNEKNISWRSYCGDVPISLVLTNNRKPKNLRNYRRMEEFFQDAKGPAEDFPQFTFIEPKYLGENQNDDHPPHNTMKAQKLIADVYNAIRTNEELWNQTLLVVIYDEHGGFYDHVVPPSAVPPDNHKEEGYDFSQLGLRVPALLISPWVKKPVEKTIFDHTSLLRYLIDKWDLKPLGNRTEHANSIGVALDFSEGPKKDCLPPITISEKDLLTEKPHLEKHDINGNHQALHLFAEFLNRRNKVSLLPMPDLSKIYDLEDKIGEKLEQYGYIRCGMWFRERADHYRQERNARTLKIFENTFQSVKIENDLKEEKISETSFKIS